jgi:hypothetical protein
MEKIKIFSLRDCYPYLTSEDYQERFIGELIELGLRIHRLETMIRMYRSGDLDFTPNCSLGILELQLTQMRGYKTILEKRAIVENIELPEVTYE